MIGSRQSAIKMNQHIPFRFFSDKGSMVHNCCKPLLAQSGIDPEGKNVPLDHLLHLDSNASKALRIATQHNEPVFFRASVRIREHSLLPVYWTVVPTQNGNEWYGFPVAEHDRIEGRLKELELIVASFHDIIFEIDKNGKFLNFWVRDPSILYIEPSVFLGKNIRTIILDYFTPLADLLLPAYDECNSTLKTGMVMYQLPGLAEWYSCRFTPVLSPDSEMVGMLIIISDITAQKKLENSLRQSEEQYRDLFENANDIIYIIDADSTVKSMNRKAEELMEYSEEEMTGRSSHLFFAPEKLANAIKYGNLKRSGNTNSTVYESEFISRSGKRIAVEISSRIIYKEDQVMGIHVTARDISIQKISQQELAKSEARFRFLSEYARDMICLHRSNGDYIYVSPSSRQLLGYEPEELIDLSPYSFIHADDSVNIESPFVQYRFRKKDGSYTWLESVSKPIIEEGELIYIQTSSRDITDRKLAEQQLVEKDRLSSGLANASRILLVENNLDQGLQLCLPVLGDAVQAECLFVLKFTAEVPELVLLWCLAKSCSAKEKQYQFKNAGILLPGKDDCIAGHIFEFQISSEKNAAIRKWMTEMGYKSLFLTPIVTSEGCWGVLGCSEKLIARNWSMNVANSLTTFASSVSSVIEKNLSNTQLRKSEERFKALFRNSLDIVFVIEPNGRVTYVTPSLQKILGYEESELLNEFCRSIIHPDERVAFNAALMQLATGQQQDLILQLRVLHRNGRWLWMELKGQSKLENPNINGIILSLRDVSEYIEIEKTLKQYSDKITSMLHSITDGFIALDRNFYITMFNNVAQELLQNSIELKVGGNAWNLLPDSKDSVSFLSLNQAVKENRTIRYEQYVSLLDCWYDVSAFPYEDGLFIYFKDATEKKQQERLLRLEKEVLEMNTGSSAGLSAIADHLLKGLEKLGRNMYCAVCLVKHNKIDAICLSAPGLPDEFRQFVETTPLDPRLTTCGRAILLRDEVVISDIENSDLAEETRAGARELGIKAVWSNPLLSSSNEILGTFAVYYTDARSPKDEEIRMIGRAIHILTMIIENKQAAEKVRFSNERYLLATQAANEAIWDWDVVNDELFWGEGFSTLFGHLSPLKTNGDFWEDNLHPDDKQRVLENLQQYTDGYKKGLFFEEYRFRKSDGNYALVIDKAYCIYDDNGQVRRMIGSMEDVTERKLLEQQLLQQEIHKQQQIAQAVVDVQENERAEIGKELHDNVNQLLTTAKLFLEVAENDSTMQRQMIRRSSDTIMGAINEIRKISRSLMPASISDLGLISSVNDLVQNIAIARQLVVDFKYDSGLDDLLPPKQKLMLFRIIQEQVNNVLKHAKATHLAIAIVYKPTVIRLEITDNGIGFELGKAKMKDGVGLSNILSRAAIFNAAVQINAAPGNGCQLIIDLPNTLTKHEKK
jgi:PAS domain S-box-containing protein